MEQTVRARITATQYFELPEYAEYDLIQLIDGEVIIGMPPVLKHQRIVRMVLIFLDMIAKQTGGEALSSPIEVYLDDDNVYEPDVLYLVPDSNCQLGEKRLKGAPDLVVEVLSPSTAKYDRHEKYQAYEQHGVREYWIIDPLHETIEIWWLDQGKFKRQGAFSTKDTVQSKVLNSSVAIKTLFP